MSKKTRIEQLLLEGKSASEIAEIISCTINYVNVVKSKFDIINGTEQMVEHHTHYREIHGYDKTVWMTRSEHAKLHQRLRKNGECNVPADKLSVVAMAASGRTDKSKENTAKYQAECKYKQKKIEYEGSPKRIKYKRDYRLKNIWEKHHWTYMMSYVTLKETIGYNIATNHISVSSGFYGSHKKKLLVIDII